MTVFLGDVLHSAERGSASLGVKTAKRTAPASLRPQNLERVHGLVELAREVCFIADNLLQGLRIRQYEVADGGE